MGVAAVDGYGPITQSNAADIYRDREVYNNLEPAQKHLVDRYVTDEEKEQIDYDMRTSDAKQSGKDKIEGADKAEEGKGQGGNEAATTAGSVGGIGGVAMGLLFANSAKKTAEGADKSSLSCWSAIIAGAIMAAAGALTIVCASKFDDAYKDRCAAKDAAGSNNDTLDAQSAALEESMGMMDKDYQEYMKGSQNLMQLTNSNNSKLADLQVQLADANAAGDEAGAERIKAEIAKLQGTTFDKDVEGLEEKRKGIEDYRTMGAETDGVIEGGTSVSEFLKEGTQLGVMATINAALLAVAAAITGFAAAKAYTSGKTPWELPVGIAAGIVYTIGAVCLGVAATMMSTKAPNEYKCGSSGRDMEKHVEALTEMKDQQIAYTDETEEGYSEEDDNRTENIAEGEDMANGNAGDNGGAPINSKPGTKKPEPGQKQTSGAAA